MATIQAHKGLVGKVETISAVYAYCADGNVLKNIGFGYQLFAKVKTGGTPQEAYQKRVAKQAEKFQKYPCYAAFAREIMKLAGINKRWKLVKALEVLGENEPDGIWSECCDSYGDNIHATLDDIVELTKLYRAALCELQAENSAKTTIE